MNIYQIYVPELATFVKYKVLRQEEASALLSEVEDKPKKEYRKMILESVIFNIKTDVADSLRMMSRPAAEKCVEALYAGCIMLNPGLDVDYWIDLAYGKPSPETPISKLPATKDNIYNQFPDFEGMPPEFEEFLTRHFKKDITKPQKQKTKKISKEKFLALESNLKKNIIGQDECIETVVSSLKRSQAGMGDENRPTGIFMFAGSSGIGKTHFANYLHRYLFRNRKFHDKN